MKKQMPIIDNPIDTIHNINTNVSRVSEDVHFKLIYQLSEKLDEDNLGKNLNESHLAETEKKVSLQF